MLDKKPKKSFYLFLVLAAFVLLAARVAYEQAHHYRQAEAYSAAQNWKLAIREYDTAIHFHVPFSPLMDKAARRLWNIGQMYETQGKPDWALIAYSSIRSGFYGTRSFYTSGRSWINKCDQKIAALDTMMLIKEGGIKPEQAESQKKKYMAIFGDNRTPSVLWSILAEIGFLGWVGSAIATIFLGFKKTGGLKPKPALYGTLCFVFFAAIWAISLLKA
ncbi:MAG: hypothetical protein M0Z61_03955 [Nitrospiraceae bacterium]|nr:hypothetical protein [Nitrospiraceae bacterium]